MYLVVASRADESASELAAALVPDETRVLTPADLSRPGWRIETETTASTFVAQGETIAATSLAGVVTRLPCVLPDELVQIREEARHYVAAEMTATLKYWLTTLRCPVVNPPTEGCLGGPNWQIERWASLALRAGVTPMPYRRGTGTLPESHDPARLVTVTLVGEDAQEECDSELVQATKAIAELAATPLLSVTYATEANDDHRFVWANTFPRLETSRAGELLLRYFDRNAPP